VSAESAVVLGYVKPGFERVAEEFERNFSQRHDVGAAFAACIDGEPVVDLWGGLADPTPAQAPWRQDTLQLIFSGTKGLVAACVLMLVDRGQLALEDAVCKHWPEFAAHGKSEITVAEVVSHRARLPGVRTTLRESDLTDDVRLAALLATQAPESDPRAGSVYHALTYGWLCGELVRRIDGRSLGRFFAEELAGPLELELWIGLPEAHESRVATLVYADNWEADSSFGEEDFADDSLLASVYGNPPILTAGRMPWNTRAFHAAEIPASNAIGSARSIARLYSCLACGGALADTRLMRPETVALGRRELSRFVEPLSPSEEPVAYGVGFQLQAEPSSCGPPAVTFGHPGAGGSVHGAAPEWRLGFSYGMNQMRPDDPDPRSRALLDALFAALRR
jgi:CubicO group peptidase (beta-lactamase class C family)